MKIEGLLRFPMHNANREKCVYGMVFEIHGISYFVPISGYVKKKQDNFLIRVKDHKKECGK